ncbi:RdgB/HAM1 family non-canonical purine NTP pyrophosphatase [Chondromyces apiculatus]|uniref:dITP/XTP pyrophosphatase n=1 Tax=Chondromyces apiculatus DSM 436 TaxID=1192034 RepID=A0A017TBQ7_9BACT|nr:RdgB/HAM1 family non-canonical purine NTP pyrophosphatase [Chondromyces apiculatus]EYF06664.1 Nucleoside 5-triphosphatase RdgB (dHAPTP, dITP, XTP-specific) [Chondromyces apiculatus DSM 436]
MSDAAFGLLLATTNRGKMAELRVLLGDLPVEFSSLAEMLPGRPPVSEDGHTFEENALIKARAAAGEAMMVTLAEDSGLSVDALGGQPGVRSARYAREGATDGENNEALLAALKDVPEAERKARFHCVMVLLDPWSEEPPVIVEGRCEGSIGREARGAGGFGYDPLFVVEGFGRTMAELGDDEKNQVSHRSQAVKALRPALEALVARRAGQARALAESERHG